MVRWLSVSGSIGGYVLVRYNTDGTFDQNMWTFTLPPNTFNPNDLTIQGTSAYIQFGGFNSIREYRLSDGTIIDTHPTNFSGSAASAFSIASTNRRFYVYGGQSASPFRTLRAFDNDFNHVPADDSPAPGIISIDSMSILGSTLYGLEGTRVYLYTGVEVSYGTWGPISYHTVLKQLSATFTATETIPDSQVQNSDFIVQENTSTTNTPVWTTASGWTITITGSGNSRTVNGTNTSVGTGEFRLAVNEDAFGTDKPASLLASDSHTIPFIATISTPTVDSFDRTLSSNVTLEHTPSSFDANDFVVEVRSGSTWSVATGWTITVGGSALARTVTATPLSTVAAGTYRFRIPSGSFGVRQPTADSVSTGTVIPAYTFGVRWGTLTWNGTTSTFSTTLEFSEIGISYTSFEVQLNIGTIQSPIWSNQTGYPV